MTWLLALALLAAPARAQQDVEGSAESAVVSSEAEAIRLMRERLKDPGVAESFADRVAGSRLAALISGAGDPQSRLRDVRAWIARDPESAAQIAAGLARDDAEGTHRFEESLDRSMRSHLEHNPGAQDNLYNRLKKSGSDSKLLKQDAEMTEEERREILKTMFEGQGNMSNKIVTPKDEKPADTGFTAGYYDRLSGANLRGYSPQVLAIQSVLNARRAPGAPRLAETGKLDYETLSYPIYGIRHDIGMLETRLRFERNYQLARKLGLDKQLDPRQLLDPAVEARLLKEGAAAALDPRFAKRQAALEKAASAGRAFQQAALAAKDPARLNQALLRELGGKQKEAARWITVASLEEELQRLDGEAGFLGPELLALIDACPLSEPTRREYRGRGELLLKSVRALKADNEEAVKLLESDGWQAAVPRVEALGARNAGARKGLSASVRDYVAVPYRLAALSERKPRWREYLDAAIRRWLPGTAHGRRLAQVEAEKDLLKQAFLKVASGEFDAAHAVLAPLEAR